MILCHEENEKTVDVIVVISLEIFLLRRKKIFITIKLKCLLEIKRAPYFGFYTFSIQQKTILKMG